MSLSLKVLTTTAVLAATAGAAFAQPPARRLPDQPAQDRQIQGQLDHYPDRVPPRGPEALYAVTAGKQSVRVRVSSNGCTKRSDFRIERRRGGVEVVRLRPDRCRSFAMGSVWIDFSYGELGVDRGRDFVLVNPLRAWTGPGE